MARLQRFPSNPIHPRLLAASCVASFLCFASAEAGKPLVQEELDAIDTTFGEAPAPSAPAPATTGTPEADSDTTTSTRSVADASESTPPPEEDGVFENVVDPGETYQRNWNLDFQTSLGGSDRDTTTGSVWIGVSRRFENEVESFVPRAGWIRTSESPDDLVSHIGIFGASVSRSFFMDFVLEGDAEWRTQDGPDAWSAFADLAWTRELSDLFELSASWASGWSNVSRSLHGASIELSACPGPWIASVGASWNRRWQEYHILSNQWKTEYVHAWGWSTSLLWTSGSWTTGPGWSGEYWRTDSRTDPAAFGYGPGRNRRFHPHSAPRVQSVSSDGVAVDQTLSWMLSWKPIESLRVKVDVSRSFGLSDATTRSVDAKNGKPIPTSTVDAYLPPDSWGGTFGFSFDW